MEDRGYRPKRWSRRHWLRGVALGSVGLAGSMLGCGERRPAAVTTTSEPKRGGILTRQSSWELQGLPLDPHVNSPTASTFFGYFYQGLIGYEYPDFDALKPELAQQWEQPSETESVFTLQPGVKWHNKPPANGRLLTVDDVVFSLERIRSRDPRFVNRSVLDTVDKIEAADGTRLRITTKEPDAGLLMKLSGETMKVLAQDVVAKADKFATPEEAVGTGPFIIIEREDRVRARYVRNPDYWKPGLPYLDEVRGPWFDSDEAQWAAFLAGRVDVAQIPIHELDKYMAARGPAYTPDFIPGFTIFGYQPNVTQPPLNDLRVALALRLLLPHEDFRNVINFGRGRHGSIFSGTLEAWDLPQEEYERLPQWKPKRSAADEPVKKALDLLSAAGYSRENPLRFRMTGASTRPGDTGDTQTQLTQDFWRRLTQGAVDVEIQLVDNVRGAQIRSQRQFTAYYGGNGGGANEPDVWFTQLYKTGGSRNYMGWSDPKFDAMADNQRRIFNIQQRKAAVREIIYYCIENCPFMKGIETLTYGATQPYVRNWRSDQFPMGRQYERVWLDK